MPAYRQSIDEPNGLNTRITRISDQTAFNTTRQYLRHHYAKNQPWNSDGTRVILAGDDENPLLDGRTYQVLSSPTPPLKGGTGSKSRWSHKDPNKMFKINGNTWYTINVSANTQTTVRTFSNYSQLSMLSEGNLSLDDKYVALAGQRISSPNGSADLWVVVYNVQTDTIEAEKMFANKYDTTNIIDWVSMSPSGQYVQINWKTKTPPSTALYEGVEIYKVISGVLTFQRQLSPVGAHGDLGYDSAGNEVWVVSERDGTNHPGVGVSMYRLSDGTYTTLLDEQTGGSPYQAGHVSCRNYKRPGWAYISTSAQSGNPVEVLAVKLDGSKTVERYGYSHNNYFGEDSAVVPVPSPDGTKVMFGSTWHGTSSSPVYSYVAEWPQSPTEYGLLSDDFEDGVANGWSPTAGTWSIVAPTSVTETYTYRQSSSSSGSLANPVPASAGGTDYSVQADIKVNTYGTSGSAMLRGRYDNSNSNNYFLLINTTKMELKKTVGGVTTSLATFTTASSTGTWYTYKLQMEGTSLKAFRNGSLMVSATDSSLTSGYARLGGFNVDIEYDNVQVFLTDDFEDGNANGWTTVGGTWSVVTDGNYVYQQSNNAAGSFGAYRGNSTWSNYSVQAKTKITSFGTSPSAILRARYADSNNYYLLLVNGTQMILKKKVGGTVTDLATADYVNVNANTWYTFKLVVNGTMIEGWMDGKRVIGTHDSALTSGHPNLGGSNVAVRYDDLLVK
jgi:hypothetical protein